jgi:hypothetical protein
MELLWESCSVALLVLISMLLILVSSSSFVFVFFLSLMMTVIRLSPVTYSLQINLTMSTYIFIWFPLKTAAVQNVTTHTVISDYGRSWTPIFTPWLTSHTSRPSAYNLQTHRCTYYIDWLQFCVICFQQNAKNSWQWMASIQRMVPITVLMIISDYLLQNVLHVVNWQKTMSSQCLEKLFTSSVVTAASVGQYHSCRRR